MNDYFIYIAASYVFATAVLTAYIWKLYKQHRNIVAQIKLEHENVEKT